jgi:hypothetical protein
MLLPQCPLGDRQRLAVDGLGAGIVPLGVVQKAQVVQDLGIGRVLVPPACLRIASAWR